MLVLVTEDPRPCREWLSVQSSWSAGRRGEAGDLPAHATPAVAQGSPVSAQGTADPTAWERAKGQHVCR